jgi:hypothetical protein
MLVALRGNDMPLLTAVKSQMEAMFRTRDSLDHEATLGVKCQFMAYVICALTSPPFALCIRVCLATRGLSCH